MRPWLLLLLLGLLTLTWWASRPEPLITTDTDMNRNQVQDYFVDNLELRQFDLQGNLAHVLKALQLRHYLESGITALSQPAYVLYEQRKPQSRIRAEKGELSKDQTRLQLQGMTFIDWEGNDERPPMKMLTADLDIYPQREYAETKAAVAVISEQNWIESVGMHAWLKSPGRIHFLAQTRAHYVGQ
jgi:lipopolysaccharide export system protein LptC